MIGCFSFGDSNLSFEKFLNDNPGIGGTEYLYLSLVLLLSKKSNLNVVLYSPNPFLHLPSNVIQIQCKNSMEAISHFEHNYSGYFIHTPRSSNDVHFEKLFNTRVIIWEHLKLDSKTVHLCAKRNDIVANIVISDAQEQWLWRSKLLKKTEIIYNFVTIPHMNRKFQDNASNVFYIGALYPHKHLDYLTNAWPKIVRKVPQAKLNVIGSASVYNSNASLGSLGIASPQYEDKILEPLKKNGILNSVSFLGKLNNAEMYESLKDCSVGVVNPVGSGETFCISALNFAVMGIPVVGANYGGLRTTLPKKCGYRINSKSQLIQRVVELLKNNEKNKQFGDNYKAFAESSFTVDNFYESWLTLIEKINQKGSINNSGLIGRRFIGSVHSFFDWLHLFAKRILNFISRHIKKS